MGSENRQIIVENDDPNIVYFGEWTVVQRSTVNIPDTLGLISTPTLQSTKTNSSFFFTFEGQFYWYADGVYQSVLTIYGYEPTGSSISVSATFNSTSDTKLFPIPSWQCSLDGISLGVISSSNPPHAILDDPWSLCGEDSIPDGSHELAVNIISNGFTPFYIEYLSYSSSPNVSRENSLIVIDNTDSAIDYPSGWSEHETSDLNGLVNITFVGIQISWYGAGEPDSGQPNANVPSGEYSVDGKPFISFQIPNNTPGTFTPLLFITPFLEMGTHILSVRYTGPLTISPTPLVLSYLIVMNGSVSPMISGGTNGTGPSHPTSPSTESRSSKIGVIVGGVVGSIVGVAIVIATFLACSRYYRRRKLERLSPDVMPFHTQDRQSTLPETVQVPKNRTQQQPNLNHEDIVLAEPSDSDSIDTNPFHTPIQTLNRISSFPPDLNIPPAATNIMSSDGIPSRQLLHATHVVSTTPIVTDVPGRDDRIRLSSPIEWGDNASPPSYTTELY